MITNPASIIEILGENYDTINLPSLVPFMRAAGLIIARVNTCALEQGITFTSAELAEMEKWMAAHLYTIGDPIYKSKTTANSSASYFDRSYLDGALALDASGCLNAVLKNQRASFDWMGLPPSEQTDYVDRN